MQQLLTLWSSLDLRRRVLLGAVSAIIATAIVAAVSIASAPNMALLYGGLEGRPAGEVVSALEQRGISYDVRGDGIYVPIETRDELRMTLASEGLPSNNGQGYELLDSLSGFGTTSQMFDAAYWRAKEGELARTILASSQISSARVHISNTGKTPFQRTLKPTASVSVVATMGAIDPNYARALRFLIASAVSGMSPEDVTVIDSQLGIIGGSDAGHADNGAFDKAQTLKESIQRLLEARVGVGNAVVEVTVDTAMETETIHERIFDPSSRVAISTDSEERSTNSQNTGRQAVTIASNLPDGDAAGDESSTNQDSETRERINYEVSETQRELVRNPGAIRKISVAVLVNESQSIGPEGEVIIAQRAPEELDAMRELVESAIGFDAERGDVVTLKSLPFQGHSQTATVSKSAFWGWGKLDTNSLAQISVLGFITLLLGIFVLKPILSQRPQDSPSATPLLSRNTEELQEKIEIARQTSLPQEVSQGEVLTNDDYSAPATAQISQITDPTHSPVERLRALIADRQEETVEILRSWMDEREETN
ncbi:flagellar basal-body MS-ring/collar protein FliF [Shimia thalassica]|uniref:flagellar basal-body MS-ring/collar protein FliF n=1 Tax=Shimia thalassica TaxID=1715693 RepID=UPI0026E3CA9D|nr:flagellar basal-body MS-ring/collar protein FliF [Shimia thalassica]MDO6485483.1 flagellar basal-body MS-ring/collar protein FliF [Shimia thalassica]